MKQRFSGHLIVSDLDGTFFGHDATLVQRNLDAIEAFQKEGGMFTISTGRMYRVISQLIPCVKTLTNAPLIACNGAVLYDMQKEEMIYYKKMPLERRMLDIIEKYLIAHEKMKCWLHVDHETKTLTAPIVCDARECFKIVITAEYDEAEGVLPPLRRELEETFGDAFSYCQSCATFLEILPIGATKGDTLQVLRKYLQKTMPDIPLTVYAVGDYENDYTMLQAADVAVCPENASQTVKEICHYQLCHHTEGTIADLIGVIAQTVSK